MVKKIRARYSDGVLTPLSMLDLPEGEVVTLTVEVDSQLSKEERLKRMKSAAGAWKGKHDPDELKRMTHSSRLPTNEWLEEVRKHKEASPTRVTSSQILEARDADRR